MKVVKRILVVPGLISLALIFAGCPKTKNVVPPVDEETQSAVQASYMNYLVSDIEMLISFMGEGQQSSNRHFYNYVSAETGTIDVLPILDGDGLSGQIRVGYNHTLCRDGRTRHGSVYLNYTVDPQHPNARYMRAYKFSGTFEFSDYTVDDYKINLNTEENGSLTIKNTLPSPAYSPLSTNLTWSLEGKLKFTHLTDNRKNMTWEGQWTKTLANTSNPLVVASPTTAINWYNADIYYTGTTRGTIPVTTENGEIKSTPFSMKFNPEYPLRRNFGCSPDPVLRVEYGNGGQVNQMANEHHPFVGGIASFTVGDSYPREIYYGNEGQKGRLPNPQCDNSGEVLIKGVSYKVDFLK